MSRLEKLEDELARLKHKIERELASGPHETVPLAIFCQGRGMLEELCVYLVDEEQWAVEDVARALHRKYTTITNTLRKARGKRARKHDLHVPEIDVPLNIFSNRKHAPLQALVVYLHDTEKMTFAQIARVLGRDPRNINATYRRVKQ